MKAGYQGNVQFSQIFFSSILRLGSIRSFREATALGLGYVKQVKRQEFEIFVADLLSKPEYAGILINPQEFVAQGLAEQTPNLLIEDLEEDYRLSVDSASLVFAHSVLDATTMDYCRLIAGIAANEWIEQLENKKVELREAINSSPEDLLRQKLDSYLDQQLEKESLIKKLDVLHAKCKPKNTSKVLANYIYDRQRLAKLDELRHYVVHGEKGKAALPEGNADIDYIYLTCWYLMAIVSEQYNLKLDPEAIREQHQTTRHLKVSG